MFAPPPAAHLTRAEIQARRAQLQAKRASAGDAGNSVNGGRPGHERTGSESPKVEKKRRPFSAGKKGIEEIREGDKEEWKFGLRKGKKSVDSAATSRMALNSTKSYPPAESPLPPPPLPPSVPSDSSFRGSDASSMAGSFVGSVAPGIANSMQEEGTGPFSGPELARRLKTPPKRPTKRPDELFVPQAVTPSGSFVSIVSTDSARMPGSMRSLESIGSRSPVAPLPGKAPPPPSPVPGALPTQVSFKSGPLPSNPALKAPTSSVQQAAHLTSPSSPPPAQSPPPIPEKSPLRQMNMARPSGLSRSKSLRKNNSHELASSEAALNAAMADLDVQDSVPAIPGEQVFHPHHQCADDAPTVSDAETSLTGTKVIAIPSQATSPISPLQVSLSSSRSGTGNRAGSVKRCSGDAALTAAKRLSDCARIEKSPLKRSAATATRTTALITAALAEASSVRTSYESGLKSNAVQQRSETSVPLHVPRSKRQHRSRGETMAMLQTSGFFPTKTGGVFAPGNPNVKVSVPTALDFADKDLPDTPGSIAPTPTELYHSPRSPVQGQLSRKSSGATAKRNPLAQITEVSAKANSAPVAEDFSPHRLTSIPEFMSLSENSAPPSGAATPVATQIHLRGGSVVTVTPPELTAWQRSVYIQGPIKLPKPAIMPRKNSVASMEPFQEAIDRVYQSALFIPRRRSDDAIVDEICDFFDDFGFDTIAFEGDMLTIEERKEGEEDAKEVDETDVDEAGRRESDASRYGTPPGTPTAAKISPLEKVVAKDVIEAFMSKASLPPIQTAEALRARGIARLSQQSARRNNDSPPKSQYAKLGSTELSPRTQKLVMREEEESVLPLLPAPEESMLDAALEVSQSNDGGDIVEIIDFDGDMGGMEWDDDVEETDVAAPWTASGALGYRRRGRHRGPGRKDSRNPVYRVKRFVTTAATIL